MIAAGASREEVFAASVAETAQDLRRGGAGVSGPERSRPPGPQDMPSEEELRAAYEAELARITTTDMIAQATVSLLNLGARRIGRRPPPRRRASAPARPRPSATSSRSATRSTRAMALLAILERRIPAEQLRPLRDALSRLQMAYAAEVRGEGGEDSGGPDDGDAGGPDDGDGGGPGDGGEGGPGGPGPAPAQGPGEQQRPGPAESSGRLWVPGS